MTSLKIALLGYGKMGREIDALAVERGHLVTCRITSKNADEIDSAAFRNSNVAIEFSRPDSAVENIKKCFDFNIPVVVGTTGWYDRLDEIKTLCLQKKQSLMYASNFSIGVNMLFELNEKLAKMMNAYHEYDVSIAEVHHLAKLDKPSGTAITLANQITGNLERKSKWMIDQGIPSADVINIESKRKDAVIGKHTVRYHSKVDELIIQHNAFSRAGFAEGALLAAEFLFNKKGVYTMNDLLKG